MRATAPIESGHANRLHAFDVATQAVPTLPDFRGVRVLCDFVSVDEAAGLLDEIERTPFSRAQSGKLKQHYGPKINFNRRRINADGFSGLPPYTVPLLDRLDARIESLTPNDPDLRDAFSRFEATDVFVLRYHARDRSNLDFHIDDTFGYGELILDLSLETDSVLSFHRMVIPDSGPAVSEGICVPVAARSLVLLYGPARFDWEHAVLDRDITDRRTSITFRTLSEDLRETEAGRQVLARSRRSL